MMAVLLLVNLLVASCSLTESTVQKDNQDNQDNQNSPKEAAIREISVRAFSFGYEPSIINVKKGESVRIVIDNTDFPHGINIPSLKVKGIDQVELTINQEGEFPWYCAAYCGEGHGRMSGKIIVQS